MLSAYLLLYWIKFLVACVYFSSASCYLLNVCSVTKLSCLTLCFV
uniref:Uncharacterized protein n=1 Tax=Rhizophora mucronata TaxID=61149 RepID=A0A2P2N7N5_RHIMU